MHHIELQLHVCIHNNVLNDQIMFYVQMVTTECTVVLVPVE